MNPTSCWTVLCVSMGTSGRLQWRPRVNQSAFKAVPGQSFFLVFMAYNVAGKKPEVQVLGENKSHFPVSRVVYCGKVPVKPFEVFATFSATRGENSRSVGGFAARIDGVSTQMAMKKCENMVVENKP
jgi:hypothetical protein